jgi:hypothetical protein
MTEQKSKIVQTPLPIDLYKKLANKTINNNISIRKGLKDALKFYFCEVNAK